MDKRPNVLIILTDQQRWDCLGAAGHPDLKTPHIDSIAADGALFTEAFCPFPVCTPSRYSFLSGLYPHQHLGVTNHCTLPAGLPTFPQALRDSGYRTAAVGKMHFTPTYLDVGFGDMELAEQDGPGRWDDDYHRWLQQEGLCDVHDLEDQVQEHRQHAPPEYWKTLGARTSNLDEAHHSTTWIGDRAMERLERWDEGGNLLMVGFIKPHHPADPPAPWDRMYDPESLAMPAGWLDEPLAGDLRRDTGYFPHADLTEASLRRFMAHYYASISQLDHQVGRMLEQLRKQCLYDRTLIVFTSDHGDYLGFHHLLLKSGFPYDPLLRIPLVIKFPRERNKAARSSRMTSNVDLAPTILEACGAGLGQVFAGRSIQAYPSGHDAIFADGGHGRNRVVRTKDRKLIFNPESGMTRLFDLETDPLEMRDLSQEPGLQPELQALKDRLLRLLCFEQPAIAPVDRQARVARQPGHDPAEEKAWFQFRMKEIKFPLVP